MSAPDIIPAAHRMLRRVERFSGSDLANGKELFCEFSDLPSEFEGRPVHVAAIIIKATKQYDGAAVTMEQAFPGWKAADTIEDIRLETAGHRFVDGLKASDLQKLVAERAGIAVQEGADIPDADATDASYSFDVYIPLARPWASGPQKWDGAVPVRMLDNSRVTTGDARLTFRTTAWSHTGLTDDGFTSLEVWVELVALDKLRRPAPFSYRVFRTTEAQRALTPFGGVESFLIASSSALLRDHSVYDDLVLDVGNRRVLDFITAEDLVALENISRKHSPLRGGSFSESAPTYLALITSEADEFRTRLARGRLRVSYVATALSSLSETRFLWFETGLNTNDVIARFNRACGAPADVIAKPIGVKPKDHRRPGSFGVLDHALYWEGMPYRIPAAKAARMLGRAA